MVKKNDNIIITGNYSWIEEGEPNRFYLEFNGKKRHFDTYYNLVKFVHRLQGIMGELGEPCEWHGFAPENDYDLDNLKDLTDAELKELGVGFE